MPAWLFSGAIAAVVSAAADQSVPYGLLPVQPDIVISNQSSMRLLTVLPSLPFEQQMSGAPVVTAASAFGADDEGVVAPPDTQGAVGPSHVVTMLNSGVRICNRQGSLLLSATLTNWWSSVGSFQKVMDPRLVYDSLSGRWIATAAAPADVNPSPSLLIAASQTTDPMGPWFKRGLEVDPAHLLWADRPTPGCNTTWVAVAASINNGSGIYQATRIWLFSKADLYNSVASAPQQFEGTNYVGCVPTVTCDPGVAELYLVSAPYVRFRYTGSTNLYSGLMLWKFVGAVGNAWLEPIPNFPVTSDNWGFGMRDYYDPPLGPQAAVTNKINLGDSRMQSVLFKNGHLWCAHTIFLPMQSPATYACAQWWQLTPNGAVIQRGRIEDPNHMVFYAYPSLAVNRFNDVLIGLSGFSATQYAGCYYAARSFFDPQNQTTVSPYCPGDGPYFFAAASANRWGDYSATVVDPLNDLDFWTVQEAAAPPQGTGQNAGDGRWKVRWAQAWLPRPSNDACAAATVLTGVEATGTNEMARATQELYEQPPISTTTLGSLWFRWTAPLTKRVALTTDPGGATVGIVVYEGADIANLAFVRCRGLKPPQTGGGEGGGSPGGGEPALTFPAEMGSTYSIAVVPLHNEYHGQVTLTLSQPSAPRVTLQPAGTNIFVGANHTLAAEIIGSPAPGLQWRTNGVPIPGATNATYAITNAQTWHSGAYTVVGTNSFGQAATAEATVKVFTSASQPLVQAGFTNTSFGFRQADVGGYWYVVEASTNLSNWVPLRTNLVPYVQLDAEATNYPRRFYRSRFVP